MQSTNQTNNLINSTSTPNTNTNTQSNLFSYIMYIFISLIFFSIGFFIYKDIKQYDTLVNAKIIESDCDKIRGTNITTVYTCTLKVEYFVEKLNTKKIQIVTVKNAIYYNGEDIAIYYNSNNPSMIKLKSDKNILPAYIFMGIGIFVFILFILNLLGIIKISQVVRTNTNASYVPLYPYNNYLTPEQSFASSVGLAFGSKLANKI
jgi:hypothetical protein